MSKEKESIKKKIENRVEGDSEERATPFRSCPETCEEMVNTYGTYNIQATANSVNDYPAIAQGATPDMEKRSEEFFRGEGDWNPASDTADEDCT